MSQHYPALLVISPLLMAFFIIAAGWGNRRLCFPFAAIALVISLLSAVGLLLQVLGTGTVTYRMGGWPEPWGIAYVVDPLNGLVLVVVAAVALANLVATRKSVEAEFADRLGAFYTLYVLFVTGLLGMVVTGDAFNLYVLLEIASLTGYALIGIGEARAPLAGLNYIFLGTIGASFYLLGIGYLYLVTGTLNMADIAAHLPQASGARVVTAAFMICMTGLFIKMALFPLHGWLPNAYSCASPAAASLIAPLTTKVMIYVMIRISLTVFTPAVVFDTLAVGRAFVWLAVGAIVMGSFLALAQRSLRRMLTYVLIAEVGYMVGGFWLGNRAGYIGAVLHILNDAAMTLCLFLCAGSILYKNGEDAFASLQGLFRRMPATMGAMVVGALSIIGVPPTCGFFSKWYLLTAALAADHYAFAAALIFSSLVNVVLFFRIFEIAYYEPFAEHHGPAAQAAVAEAPASMTLPLLVVAVSLVVLGLYAGEIVNRVIAVAVPAQLL